MRKNKINVFINFLTYKQKTKYKTNFLPRRTQINCASEHVRCGVRTYTGFPAILTRLMQYLCGLVRCGEKRRGVGWGGDVSKSVEVR